VAAEKKSKSSQQQMDLFGSDLSNDAIGAPAWLELPAEARAALTWLIRALPLLRWRSPTGRLNPGEQYSRAKPLIQAI
jgi:hypothetical protein